MSGQVYMECKGYNGSFILTDTGVTIKRGTKGFLLGGGMLRGDKTIPYQSIVAVQLKKAGLTAGYIQLTLKGGSETKKGLFQARTDENTISFWPRKNKEFEAAKKIIEEKINESSQGKQNDLGELERLAELKDKGIISEEEFNIKKKELLDI